MKKTIIGIIVGLLLGLGIVGAYLYFNNNAGGKNNKEENKTENNEETKKDEYYQFYFENGKIYYSLNKGEKKYLMDSVKDGFYSYLYDNYLYDDDKLYYYTSESDPVGGYKHYFNYIDLKTLKKSTEPIIMENDGSKSIGVREISNGKVYYAYEYHDNNNQSYKGINEYSFKDKTTKKIIEKPVDARTMMPYITIYNDVMYVQLADGVQTNIYKIQNDKEEIIVKNVESSIVNKVFKVLNNKLYYIDSGLLFSYDIDKGISSKESESLTKNFGNALVFSDMIAYVTDSGYMSVKTKSGEKKIFLNFDSSICTSCVNVFLEDRISENELGISSYYNFSALVDLNNVVEKEVNPKINFAVNVNKAEKSSEDADSWYYNRYIEYRR